MATNKKNAPNIDLSDLPNYPDGRIKDNSGSGDGTPVNRLLYSDLHEFFAKIMRMANIAYSGLPDNETNGHQLVAAAIALAGKNDFVYPISDIAGIVNIATDLAILKDGEIMMAKAGFNFVSQANIKGVQPTLYNITVPSAFKTNDYVLLIKSGSGFNIIRLAEGNNIDAIVAEYNYLKAATTTDEFAGISNSSATTPYTNQLAFARRVIGLDSAMFLATTSRNGLFSKEDKAILDGLQDPVKNRGWFSGLNIATPVGTMLPRFGDVVSATVITPDNPADETFVRVVVQNAMGWPNYYVRMFVESEASLGVDNDGCCPVFKKEAATQFLIGIKETAPGTQSLKIHIEVVQI